MLLSLGSAADLIDKAIQKIVIKGSEPESRMFEQYYNVESGIDDYYMKDSSISGLGYASRVLENAVITEETPIQGYDKTYTQVEYAKILPITKHMWKFGIKKRNLTNVVNELKKACSDLREKRCAERLENGYSTSYTAEDDSGNFTVACTGGNGVALFSASQTREDGGTDNNNIVYDGMFSRAVCAI